jgi:AbrB family looped-hinge helix DNA binding protein
MANKRKDMITAKVLAKGQITIPKFIREMMGLRSGDSVGFEEREGAILIRKMVGISPFDNWTGRLKHLKGQRSDELVKEIRGAVDDERAELINKRKSLQP